MSEACSHSEYTESPEYVYPTGPKQYLRGDEAIVIHVLHPDEEAKEALDLSWSHIDFTNSKTVKASTTDDREYKGISRACLGVYRCPNDGCKYRQRPRQNQRGGRQQNNPTPLPPSPAECKVCATPTGLVHVPCPAKWNIKHYRLRDKHKSQGSGHGFIDASVVYRGKDIARGLESVPVWPIMYEMAKAVGQDVVVIYFHGPHSPHGFTPHPPATFIGKRSLRSLLELYPDLPPKALWIGGNGRMPARLLDPAFEDKEVFRRLVLDMKHHMGLPTSKPPPSMANKSTRVNPGRSKRGKRDNNCHDEVDVHPDSVDEDCERREQSLQRCRGDVRNDAMGLQIVLGARQYQGVDANNKQGNVSPPSPSRSIEGMGTSNHRRVLEEKQYEPASAVKKLRIQDQGARSRSHRTENTQAARGPRELLECVLIPPLRRKIRSGPDITATIHYD